MGPVQGAISYSLTIHAVTLLPPSLANSSSGAFLSFCLLSSVLWPPVLYFCLLSTWFSSYSPSLQTLYPGLILISTNFNQCLVTSWLLSGNSFLAVTLLSSLYQAGSGGCGFPGFSPTTLICNVSSWVSNYHGPKSQQISCPKNVFWEFWSFIYKFYKSKIPRSSQILTHSTA